MKKSLKFLALMCILVSLITGCAREADTELPLSDEQIAEAIRLGSENIDLTVTEFVSDWTVDLGYRRGRGKAVLMTPFLRLALVSKQSAEAGRKVDDRLARDVLKEIKGLLHFEVDLYGGTSGFGKTAEFSLHHNGQELYPVYSFMPGHSEFSREYTHIVAGRVRFDKEGIPDDAVVILTVEFVESGDFDPETKAVLNFEFDLSSYR